jgi:DNA end-binding protein Ku
VTARAMWKGQITFGTVDVPVKLYSAVRDQSIHFRLLDAKRKEPVRQHMIEADSGDVVENTQTHKAFAAEKGKLVVLEPEELEQAQPKESRDVDVTRFVPEGKITHQWYNRPYWLGPDKGGTEKYFALVAALKHEKREGVAQWVMRKKEYVGALRVEGDYLMLITLRHADEVVPANALTPPEGRDLSRKEIEMAKQLVAALEGDFDISEYKDEYRERVLELVEAKAKGKVIRLPKAKPKKADEPLMGALERSLAAARRKSA